MTQLAGGTADLWPLFEPRGIAVVGASRNPNKLGAALARSLDGFAGNLALVNARDETMYPSVAAAAGDGPVDVAMICLPAAACPGMLAEAAEAGACAAVISGGGFAEAGAEGAALQDELAAVVADTGIRLLGPNTSGYLAPGLTASFVPGAGRVRAGGVSLVAASGGVNHAVAFALSEAGHGVRLAVGIGNGVDITAADVLEHLATDPATRAVALHVESVSDGPRLVRAVAALVPSTPVVALVVGRNDVGEFAQSHTGSLATSWRTTRAALAQAGAVLVENERELVDAVGALSVCRAAPAQRPGVGVLTAQAGPGLLLLDELRGHDVAVPELTGETQSTLDGLLPALTFQRNPVDTGRPSQEFGAVLGAVSADSGVDLVAGYALYEPDAVDLVAAVHDGRGRVPVVLGVGGTGAEVAETRRALLAAGVAAPADPHGVATATRALLADARAMARLGRTQHAAQQTITVDCDRYDEAQAKSVLEALGVRTMPRRVCTGREQAHQALADLGTALAVKLLDADVLHKTERGGVHLNVRTAAELDAALDGLAAIGANRFLVEAMAPSGVDLIVGARRDPVFGPVVLLGLGGVTAEALADVAVRTAPLSLAEAAAMPHELAARQVLHGWRGGPVLDVEELAGVLVSLGSALCTQPKLTEIEINPLRLCRDGLRALDAVVITKEEADGHSD